MDQPITFHTFNIGDVEDLSIYVSFPLQQWLDTAEGQWVQQHATDLTWVSESNVVTMGHSVAVRGYMQDSRLLTEYFLRWPKKSL
jgi:hypothetical protein